MAFTMIFFLGRQSISNIDGMVNGKIFYIKGGCVEKMIYKV
jgi:hypothetical protein